MAIPVIVAAERLSDGVVVKFSDGTCVFYPAGLLYAAAGKAYVQNELMAHW